MTKKPSEKYYISGDEDEVLPNKLGLTELIEVNREEFIGFLSAQEILIDKLNSDTRFDVKYLYAIHKRALGYLYAFAGKLRSVNMSKGNFLFPTAHVLAEAMETFEKEMLKPLNTQYQDEQLFIKDLAKMHAELLYIHPFREGNGRTIRLFTNLIALKQFSVEIDFPSILKNQGTEYIKAVQQAALQEYYLMEDLLSRAFTL